jgi:lauroyl/myristoyl acyltransferase
MLFAWVDDKTAQNEIMALKAQGAIEESLKSQKGVIFAIDHAHSHQFLCQL